MKAIFFLLSFSILFLLVVFPVFGKIPIQAIDYFQQGDFPKAKKILEDYLWYHPQDQEALFYLAQLEPEGKKSIDYFEKVLDLSGDFEYEDEVLLRMCQYDFSKGLYLTILNSANIFERKFKASPHYPQILLLSASAWLAVGETKKAQEKYELLSSFSDNDWKTHAKLGKADCLFADGQFLSAVNEYKKLIQEFEDSDLLSTALIGISNCYAQMGEKDKAILYYNLYKEKSPYGIKTEESLTDIIKPQEPKTRSHKTEELVDARYTIQLGVFGVEENARRLYSEFKAKGYTVRILNKIINKKKYYIVQLGSFRSYDKAQRLREKLEKESGESYRIVLR